MEVDLKKAKESCNNTWGIVIYLLMGLQWAVNKIPCSTRTCWMDEYQPQNVRPDGKDTEASFSTYHFFTFQINSQFFQSF